MKSSQKYIVTAVKCYEGKGKEQKTTLEENSLSLLKVFYYGNIYMYIKQERIMNSQIPITCPQQLSVFHFISPPHILLPIT